MKEKEQLRSQQEILLQYSFLLAKMDKDLPKVEDGHRVMFSMLCGSMIESIQSILILSENAKLRDCMGLSRMVFELALNIGYFSYKENKAVDQALKHAHQKTYRDIYRVFEYGSVKIPFGKPENAVVEINDKLQEAIDEYSTSRGKEVRDWTGDKNDNVFKKIELIKEKFGDGFGYCYSLALFSIYRHSSEILHGTIFGTMYSGGLTLPKDQWPRTDKKRLAYQYNEIRYLLEIISFLSDCTLRIINSHYPNESVMKEVDDHYELFKASKE